MLVAGACLSAWQSAGAGYTLTTGAPPGADEDVVEIDPGDNGGGRPFLELRSRNIAGTARHRIAFFRFDLTGVTNAFSTATLRFWIASSQTDSDPFRIDVLGVADAVAGEHDWSESALIYATAPGLAAGDYPDIDRDHAAGEVIPLGSVSYPGGGYSGPISLSGPTLADFLHADADDGVPISAGQTHDVGPLLWMPPQREAILWQVGTPDRSAAEFRFGDRMRQFGLWWRYLKEQGTAELDYIIGENTSLDWYYAQTAAALDDGTYHAPTWNVVFDLDAVPASPCELVLDLASTMRGSLTIHVNGTAITTLSLDNNGGIYRSANRIARHTQRRVIFSDALLHTGTNRISFRLNGPSTWTGDRPAPPSAGVMYDAVRLEAGPPIPEMLIQDPSPQQVYDAWAATQLPPGDHGFAGDANLDGVANGYELAYAPMTPPLALLTLQRTDGSPIAVGTTAPTTTAAAYTRLETVATRDLTDWAQGAVSLNESSQAGMRAWTTATDEDSLFFRTILHLLPEGH